MIYWVFLLTLIAAGDLFAAGRDRILNVSYDVSRELFEDYNVLFTRHYQSKHGSRVLISQSHAGSSKQARAVVDGIPADVITMNQPSDLDAIVARGRNLVVADWRTKFPHDASPYTSCVAFMVRKGNPKGIRDWDDLVKAGTVVVVPNPKTSGSGRYGYLGAYAYAKQKAQGRAEEIDSYIQALFHNVPVLDSGGRAATTTFVQRGIGDVLLALEAEILTTVHETSARGFEIVYPSISVSAEMPIAINERVVNRRGTRAIATEYLLYLYSEEAQDLLARHFYRPSSEAVLARHRTVFPVVEMVTVDRFFGGWDQAHQVHFAAGGTFDRIYSTRK